MDGNHIGPGLAFTRDILAVTGISIRETGEQRQGARFGIHIPPAAGSACDGCFLTSGNAYGLIRVYLTVTITANLP
ncbi:hypothetical protein [Methanoregula sp.]|uniref:hypothetical protein n=1 Tax=Methanoregula sp. TaxID=2052170 RepID=UPI003C71CFE9